MTLNELCEQIDAINVNGTFEVVFDAKEIGDHHVQIPIRRLSVNNEERQVRLHE